MRRDVVDLCAEQPRDRSSLLRALLERGHPPLEQGPISTFVPWLSTQGLIVTDAAGLLQAAGPAPDPDESPIAEPPPCLLLAAFDTLMLGYRTREPFVPAEHDHHILKGGGMLKPVVLSRGLATGTWSLNNGRPAPAWFGDPTPPAALSSETAEIERFLTS